jgi:hypothetical protein
MSNLRSLLTSSSQIWEGEVRLVVLRSDSTCLRDFEGLSDDDCDDECTWGIFLFLWQHLPTHAVVFQVVLEP